MKFFSKGSQKEGLGIATGVARIDVDGGYTPDEIVVAAGAPARLVFHRHDNSACSEQVVFPQLGLRADLPQHKDVIVELPAIGPGDYDFECGMGMLHGRVVVR